MTLWSRIGRGALVALAISLVVVSFLPIWWTDQWWVRMWDFPRLQVSGLIILAIPALVLLGPERGRWPMVGLLVGSLAWQVSHFLPYFPPYPKHVATADNCPPDRQLSLLNANVLLTNDQYGPVRRLVERWRPDVLLLLEPGRDWADALGTLDKDFPYRLSHPLPNTYGMILMSRVPMEGRIEHLLQPAVPSAQVRLTLRGGETVELHAVHPEPPLPGDDSGERDAELVLVGRKVRDHGRAAIVMGDLNDVGWSRTSRLFREIAGMADPRVGRGFYPTFNANYPLLRWPLDHIFVSPHFEVQQIRLLPDIGSDHLPIFFQLCLRGNAAQRKVAPAASPDTEAEASAELTEGAAEQREESNAR